MKFGDLAFHLFADKSGQPAIMENAIYNVSWSDICAASSMDSVQALNLFFVPSKVSIEDNAAWIMVCCIITDNNRLPS